MLFLNPNLTSPTLTPFLGRTHAPQLHGLAQLLHLSYAVFNLSSPCAVRSFEGPRPPCAPSNSHTCLSSKHVAELHLQVIPERESS